MARLRRTSLLSCWAISVSACNAHVELRAPEPTAPLAERAAAYRRLRPMRFREVTGDTHRVDYLELGDRTRVYAAEDLLPLVDPQSKTAQDIERAKSRQASAGWLALSALVCAGAGTALIYSSGIGRHDEPNGTLLGAGAAIGFGGTLGFALGASAVQSSAAESQISAYSSYDGELQRRLGVCAGTACTGLEVQDRAEQP